MAAIKPVTSRDNPLIVRLRKLAGDPAAYRKLGTVWVEGEHLCSALVQKGAAVSQAVITEQAWEQPALRALAEYAPEVIVVPSTVMKSLSSLESPAPLAFAAGWLGMGSVRPAISSVVLDRVQDAGNVGAIIRTAAAFGFGQVIALKGSAALWSPKVLRSGMGAHFGIHLVEAADESVLDELQLPLLATSSHASQALHEANLPWPCAWVMGHEGQGISPSVAGRCGITLSIPQPGGEESLNVAVAAAVCFYESARQRFASGSVK